MNPPSGCLRYFKDVVIISSGLISGYVQGQLQPQYGMIVKAEQVPDDYLEQLIKLVQKKSLFHITQICRVHSAKQKTKYILTIVPKAQLTMQIDQMLNLQQLMSLGLLSHNISLFTSILYQTLHKVNELHAAKVIHAALVPSNIYMNIKNMKLLLGPPLGLSRPFLSHSALNELKLSTPPELATGQFKSVSWKTDCYQIGYTLLCLVKGSVISTIDEMNECIETIQQAKKKAWCGALNVIAITRLISDYNERPRVGSVLECLTDGLIMQQQQFHMQDGIQADAVTGRYLNGKDNTGKNRLQNIWGADNGNGVNMHQDWASGAQPYSKNYSNDSVESASRDRISMLIKNKYSGLNDEDDSGAPISPYNNIKKPRGLVNKQKKNTMGVLKTLEQYEHFSCSTSSNSNSHGTGSVSSKDDFVQVRHPSKTNYEVISPPGYMSSSKKRQYVKISSKRLEKNKQEIQWLMQKYKELSKVISLEQKRQPEIIKRFETSENKLFDSHQNQIFASKHNVQNEIQKLISKRSGYVLKLHRFCFRNHDDDRNMNVSCQLFTQCGRYYGEISDVVFKALPCEGVSKCLNDCYLELHPLDETREIPDGPLTKKLSRCHIKIFTDEDDQPKSFDFNFVTGQSQEPQWCSAVGTTDRIQVSLAVLG